MRQGEEGCVEGGEGIFYMVGLLNYFIVEEGRL
jgi:hypothetical protein